MNILVYDVAASESGALNVLTDFYNEVKYKNLPGIHWYFLVSTPEFDDTENITVIRVPEVKKGWNHRIAFELFRIQKILKQHHIDYILSLQNIKIMRTRIPQIVYMHNIIPFTEYKFKFKDDKLLWVYQNLIAKLIYYSLKKADYVLVQAEWIRNICINKLKLNPNKIKAVTPYISIKHNGDFSYNEETSTVFFYPAMAFSYKNHRLILEAAKLLIEEGIDNFQVIFTLSKDDKEATQIIQFAEDNHLPISFAGKISRHEVMELYKKSVLVFPSKVETIGLPLMEAASCNDLIFAADYLYAKEALRGYENVSYFSANNANELKELMRKSIEQQFKIQHSNYQFQKEVTILDLCQTFFDYKTSVNV